MKNHKRNSGLGLCSSFWLQNERPKRRLGLLLAVLVLLAGAVWAACFFKSWL